MKYHKPSNFSYDIENVLACLPQTDPGPVGMTARSCTPEERRNIEQLLNLGLPIRNILYFQLSARCVGGIHTDVIKGRHNDAVRTALLLPLSGCDGVNMRWYVTPENKHLSENDYYYLQAPSGGYATCVKPESVLLDEEIFCSKPIVAQVEDWHAISNDASQVGRIISVRFSPDITYEQLCERFGPA